MCVQPLNSSFISTVKTEDATVQFVKGTGLSDSTMWDIISVSPQAQNSDDDRPHFFRQNAQRPWPVRKRFKAHHCARGRLKPGTGTLGSLSRPRSWLTTDVVLQVLAPAVGDVDWLHVGPQRFFVTSVQPHLCMGDGRCYH